ncbi:hypothetical protein SISNIDRAFT_437665 [Sistotremastrum niveocremeum HHB9708]|uniref:E2 ubiquitin-conjugating enzyme n=1 Tax=Sistotremastrum niveocremeum HHB9708 TaxID=1314777 RepID=A0A164YG21_9AGAM|nr:hypothetical protein SISNIDRAFT_437665 [Sistotremastrum niveocremeum HHB9708]
MTIKRVHREIADLAKEDLGKMTLGPKDDNLFEWKAMLPGPEGSVYEGGLFQVDIVLPADYPFSAPKVTFATRIYHMNISERGNVCMDLLKNNWSPALSLYKAMLSLSSLLTDPNPKDPLVPQIATQYTRSRKAHDETARQYVQLYALPSKSSSSKPPSVISSQPVPGPTLAPIRNVRPRRAARHPVAPSTDLSVPIDLTDSDPPTPVAGRKRKPESNDQNGRRKRISDGSDVTTASSSGSRDVIVIDD